MKKYVLTSAARADLAEVGYYYAQRSGDSRRRILAELRNGMRRIAAMPSLGHLREDLADEPLRSWTVRSFLIIYRPKTEPVQVVRVLHAARDVRRLLEDEA